MYVLNKNMCAPEKQYVSSSPTSKDKMSNPNDKLINDIAKLLSDNTREISGALIGFLLVFGAAFLGLQKVVVMDNKFIQCATNEIIKPKRVKQGFFFILFICYVFFYNVHL